MSVSVELKGVAKVYESRAGPVHAFGPVDLAVEEGRFVALVGPSGCGKSTLLLMIAGLLEGSAGEILVAGSPVRGPQTNIGMVFQNPVLVDWRTVLGNVLLQIDLRGLRRRDFQGRAEQLLASVGLSEFANRHPYELSGGMQQRTAFCRALIHDPPLILMDEPLGALDAMTREQLRADLERLWMESGKTVLLVTHSIEEAVQLADLVVVISPRPGRVVREIRIDLPRPRTLEVCETPVPRPRRRDPADLLRLWRDLIQDGARFLSAQTPNQRASSLVTGCRSRGPRTPTGWIVLAPFERRHPCQADDAGPRQPGFGQILDRDVVRTQVLHVARRGDHGAEAGVMRDVESVGGDDQGGPTLAAMSLDERKRYRDHLPALKGHGKPHRLPACPNRASRASGSSGMPDPRTAAAPPCGA